MAVIREYPFIHNGTERTDLERHYSDSGKMILQKETGVVYSEAVDVYPCRYTYEEVEGAEDETERDSVNG